MLKKILLSVSLLSITTSLSHAATETTYKEFKFEGDSIHTIVPEGWSALNGYLNVPVALVSQKGAQDQRSVIQIIPMGTKEEAKEFARLEKDPAEYYDQKEETLSKSGGEPIAREPLREIKKDGLFLTSIGIQYRNAFGEFLDESHFVQAKSGKFYFVKDLIPLDQEKRNRQIVSEVINALSAKN